MFYLYRVVVIVDIVNKIQIKPIYDVWAVAETVCAY